MHFEKKNGNLTPRTAQHRANAKELFIWKVILQQFLKPKIGHCLAKMYRPF